MFEIALVVAACVVMGKLADAENRPSLTWGVITLGFCMASLFIPLPMLRILLAGLASLVALMVAKARAGR